jgi:carbonic anhydrase/acetyltransferase-like protein (isoleucine patch superfamily)
MKKYEMTDETIVHQGHKLRRIRALTAFHRIEAGEIGGWVEAEENLSQQGLSWVGWNAKAYGEARISEDAGVYGDAEVFENAQVCGRGWVYGDAKVFGDAIISGDARIGNDARVHDGAKVFGNAEVFEQAEIHGQARIHDEANVLGQADVSGNAEVFGNAIVQDDAVVAGGARVSGCMHLGTGAEVLRLDHVFSVGPLGHRNPYLTFYRTGDRQIGIFSTYGAFPIEIFRMLMPHQIGWIVPETDKRNYQAACEMAMLQINLRE